ncbi:MAG: anti-sigma factor [Planctomycetes bacterium]|nr:anti-sigma factor [Planctomycetota bacterium]
MDCQRIQILLSAFQDAELTGDDRRLVDKHLHDCAVCTAELAELNNLRELVRSWPEPQPPRELWDRIESAVHPSPSVRHAAPRRKVVWAQLATVAALLLIAVGTGLWARWLQEQPNDQPRLADTDQPPRLAVDLDEYLDTYQRDPQHAPHLFIARYNGQAVNLDETADQVNYRPIATDRLPEGFSLDRVYLLKMECCTGVQTVYRRKGSDLLAILQHTVEQPVWYGNRRVEIVQVNGKPTQIVRINGQLAATWQADGTYVSLIGARDMTELTEMIVYLDAKKMEN